MQETPAALAFLWALAVILRCQPELPAQRDRVTSNQLRLQRELLIGAVSECETEELRFYTWRGGSHDSTHGHAALPLRGHRPVLPFSAAALVPSLKPFLQEEIPGPHHTLMSTVQPSPPFPPVRLSIPVVPQVEPKTGIEAELVSGWNGVRGWGSMLVNSPVL